MGVGGARWTHLAHGLIVRFFAVYNSRLDILYLIFVFSPLILCDHRTYQFFEYINQKYEILIHGGTLTFSQNRQFSDVRRWYAKRKKTFID